MARLAGVSGQRHIHSVNTRTSRIPIPYLNGVVHSRPGCQVEVKCKRESCVASARPNHAFEFESSARSFATGAPRNPSSPSRADLISIAHALPPNTSNTTNTHPKTLQPSPKHTTQPQCSPSAPPCRAPAPAPSRPPLPARSQRCSSSADWPTRPQSTLLPPAAT